MNCEPGSGLRNERLRDILRVFNDQRDERFAWANELTGETMGLRKSLPARAVSAAGVLPGPGNGPSAGRKSAFSEEVQHD